MQGQVGHRHTSSFILTEVVVAPSTPTFLKFFPWKLRLDRDGAASPSENISGMKALQFATIH